MISTEDVLSAHQTLSTASAAGNVGWPRLLYVRCWATCSVHGHFWRTMDEGVYELTSGYLLCPDDHGEGVTRRCQIKAVSPDTGPSR